MAIYLGRPWSLILRQSLALHQTYSDVTSTGEKISPGDDSSLHISPLL